MFRIVVLLSLFAVLFTPLAHAGDWPWWRGPDRNGVAEEGQNPPLDFGGEENVKWAIDIPGRSHGSVCVFGDWVFYAAADEAIQIQTMNAVRRDTGRPIWRTTVHLAGFQQKLNKKASWASGTPACDGERVFISFLNGDSVYATAFNAADGQQLWQTKITGYKVHQGYGASPAIYENLVIIAADNKKAGAMCGLDRETGEVVWKVERGPKENYPSPIILEIGGKDQLVMTGINKIVSYDPLTGKVNWETEGSTTECVTSTVTDGEHIFTSGGYPKNHVSAIKADGSGEVAWEIKDRVYVPSMLVKDGHLFAVMDSGVAACWQCDTGEEKWKARLGGNFSASPILVGDRIYAANEKGDVFVFRASTEGLEILAENKVGDEVFASPVICDSEIYLRVAFYKGEERSEKLICFARK